MFMSKSVENCILIRERKLAASAQRLFKEDHAGSVLGKIIQLKLECQTNTKLLGKVISNS